MTRVVEREEHRADHEAYGPVLLKQRRDHAARVEARRPEKRVLTMSPALGMQTWRFFRVSFLVFLAVLDSFRSLPAATARASSCRLVPS